MNVLANRHDMADRDGAAAAAGVPLLPLEELLPQCDFVSLHLPLTATNRHMIDADAIALMKPGAILINTSRGALVDVRAAAPCWQPGTFDWQGRGCSTGGGAGGGARERRTGRCGH